MIIHSTIRKIHVFQVEIKDLGVSFQLKSEVSKAERETLLSLPHPNYEAVLKQHQHLRNITMKDMDKKAELPIHLILGASDYTNIKAQEMLRFGKLVEPVAKLTRFG